MQMLPLTTQAMPLQSSQVTYVHFHLMCAPFSHPSSVRHSLFINAGFCPTHLTSSHSCAWRRWYIHEDVPAALAYLPSRVASHGILLSRSLKKLKPALHLVLGFCYVSCTLISVVETLQSHACCSQGCTQPSHS